MILYHGSYTAVEKTDLSFSRPRTDFGLGFYLTPLREQAASWANRFLIQHETAFITAYEFLSGINNKLPTETKILEFDAHNREWLDFITACRLGLSADAQWDLVIGGVANDKVFDTLQLYFDKYIDAEEAIGRLRYNKPNFQYCFKKQALIDQFLQYKDLEVLK